MAADLRGSFRHRQARRESRYDTSPPRWVPALPGVSVLVLLAVDQLFPRGHDRAVFSVVALAVYLVLMLGFLLVAWRWQVRCALLGAGPHVPRFAELGPPTRFQVLAPVGAVLFGVYAVLIGTHAVESAAGARWLDLALDALFCPLWTVLLFRCLLATRRLAAGWRGGSQG